MVQPPDIDAVIAGQDISISMRNADAPSQAAYAQFRRDFASVVQSWDRMPGANPAPLPARANDLDPWRPARAKVDPAMYFEVYRAEQVHLTSVLRNGGDWRWRFCAADGAVLAGNGGYRTEAECIGAVDALRHNAGAADFHRRPLPT